ncbi:MAG: C25 family cysteine peptidase [Pyrinomonadaceae bacterium]
MKKKIIAMVLLNFLLLMNFPISAQNLNTITPRAKKSSGVKYSSIKAFSNGNGALIEWDTEFENSNLGYSVYRGIGEQRQLVSTSLIPGRTMRMRGGTDTGFSYSFFDPQGDLNSTYSIESLDDSGQTSITSFVTTEYRNNSPEIEAELSNRATENSGSSIVQSELILSKALRSEIEQNSLQADAGGQSWVAAQPGVKIGVKKEGIHRVTRAQLEAGGFNVTASPSLWQLYVNGVEQAITVAAGGSYIEFFGKGIDGRDSDTQNYFLVVGTQNGKRILPSARRSTIAGSPSSNYAQSFVFKERTNYSSSIFNGEIENFFGRLINSTGTIIPLNLTGIDTSTVTSSIDITLQGLSLQSHQTKVVLNGTELGVVLGDFRALYSKRFEFATSLLVEGTNNLQLVSINGAPDTVFFDTLKVNYARKYQAEQNTLSFSLPLYKSAILSGFSTAKVRVFDVTLPGSPKLLTGLTVQPDGSVFKVLLPSNTGRILYAVEDSAIITNDLVAQNFPSTLSTAAHNAEMVIIYHKTLAVQAAAWADYRRSQGLTVKLVDIEDVFDEFSNGTFDSEATKSFLEYAKNNWQTPPKYVLLIGDAHFDTRGYRGASPNNLIPTKMVETVYLETGSDDYLADFNEDGLADIAIGRIAVISPALAAQALEKTKSFESTVGQNFNRGFLFVSDSPEGYDFNAVSGRLRDLLPDTDPSPDKDSRKMITYKTAGNITPDETRANIINEMNLGKYVVNYSGHGTASAWSAGAIFTRDNGAGFLNNGDKLTVFSMLTCLNGYFIGNNVSLGETLVNRAGGGAVAVWASSGETTPDIQETMATRFYQQLALGNIARLGDLANDAKTTISAGRDVRLSWVLLSDPTLKMR